MTILPTDCHDDANQVIKELIVKQRTYINPMARALFVLVAVAGIVSGVTFATLQSQQAKFTGNTIRTATADLRVSSDGLSANYSNAQNGFVFGNLIPGGLPSPEAGVPVYLKNFGDTSLSLRIAAGGNVINPKNVDLSKVNIILVSIGGGTTQTFTLKALMDASATGGIPLTGYPTLAKSTPHQFGLQVSMEADAFSGNDAEISGIDISFSGVAIN